MSQGIRLKDYKLINILRDELKEFVPEPIPDHNLENTLYLLMNYIRKNSRSSTSIINIDDLSYWSELDENFYYQNKAIEFTQQEKKLLSFLFKNINYGVSYHSISNEIWGEIVFGSNERIKTVIKQLRKKLPRKLIKNIFAYGYKIEIPK